MSLILESLKSHIAAVKSVEALEGAIQASAERIADTLKRGGKILLMGNGGSAADSQHLAAEFVGRFKMERRGLAAIALTTDTSILTAIANDYGAARVFARQIEALGRQGDCVIGISTSGNSANIIEAFLVAREIGCHTIGLLGNNGGRMVPLCDLLIVVASNDTPRIQECQILIGHIICDLVERGVVDHAP
jgi:D-sedoheptulose 7-phosphate isomerase